MRHSWRQTASFLSFCLITEMAEARCADLALVLAIDSSGSIDEREFALQQQGYADAFRSLKVLAALQDAGTVNLSIVFWGDSAMPVQVLPWQRLDQGKGAERLAEMIEVAPRQVTGNTSIGTGLWVALDILDDPSRCAYRSLINVSGDGVETISPRQDSVTLHQSRDRARASGVTINALAISDKNGVLADWYREKVITGPGSFVIQITSFADFANSIAEKLAREIGPPTLAALQP